MKIIKRNGAEEEFSIQKIAQAISKANKTVPPQIQMSEKQIETISKRIELACTSSNRAFSVEEIQDLVEKGIMEEKAYDVAQKYITYRYSRNILRQANTTDAQILSLIDCNNEEIKQENSNKNPTINSVQRDYMAGEVSKDITKRFLLPQDIIEAHEQAIIHFHDADYFAQHMHNCCLVNLEDMLQNGTVISGTMIEKPKSFSTACNIATQIMAQVASSQYGGQSISMTHLAPFVEVSRQKIQEELREESELTGIPIHAEAFDKIVENRLRKEIKKGVQTIQYQVVTLMTTNGQAPFVTLFLYLGEARNEREQKDLAIIIEEVLEQRIKGVKNESGVYVTPAFPKLIYVLEENNITPDSEYWYLTELAAKCTAKRMVPDYISAKIMKQLKIDKAGNGNVYTCMGCLDHDEMIETDCGKMAIGELIEGVNDFYDCFDAPKIKETFDSKFVDDFFVINEKTCLMNIEGKINLIREGKTIVQDIKLLRNTEKICTPRSVVFKIPSGSMKIKCKGEFVELKNLIFNENVSDWLKISYMIDGCKKSTILTTDHPLPVFSGEVKQAKELTDEDKLILCEGGIVEIVSIEPYIQTKRSYDVTTETEYFDLNGDILSHNCRSFLTPYVNEMEIDDDVVFEL